MSKFKMAIIGHGFVGKAVDYGFNNPDCVKFIVDPQYNYPISNLPDDLDLVFVCVPTPMGPDGTIDSSIIESVLAELSNQKALIVVKSTVTPDIVSKFGDNIVYNPEFLTEKSANEDFVNPIMHIFGGLFDHTKYLERIYEQYSSCKPCPVFHMTAVDASFVKYGVNSYLASKVVWFNQFYDVVQKHEGNFGKIISAIGSDSRVGLSHTTVPGWDGRRGFGGSCFNKDVPAFIRFSNGELSVLREVWNVNCDYRNCYNELLDREKEQNIKLKKI